MAVARTPLRLMLRPLAAAAAKPACVCRISSTATRSAGRRYCKTYIPEEAKSFMRPDGLLYTTATNRDFLARYNLEWDSGKMFFMGGPLFAKMGILLRFTYGHMVSMYDLKYLNPAGHPMQEPWMATTAHMAQTQPLWCWATVANEAWAVVRHTAGRGLRSRLYKALEAGGYDMYGKAKGSRKHDLKGTLWMHIGDPTAAVSSMDKDDFGPALVQELEKLMRYSPQEGVQGTGGPRHRPHSAAAARASAHNRGGFRRDNTSGPTGGRSFRPRD